MQKTINCIVMRQTLTIILFLIGVLSYANMASPIREGTFSSSAFSSRNIDIIKERIHLKIDKNFEIASYEIEYFIKAETEGNQIPLLFLALDFNDEREFKVWVDNCEVSVLNVPEEYKSTAKSPFQNFSNYFGSPDQSGGTETTTIYWQENVGYVYELNELKYFEANLSKGEHVIRIEYTAFAWTNISDWVKEYSFRYSLFPAKEWKSFGSLEIILDASAVNSDLTTNLGQLTKGRLDSIAVWNFSKLPANYFEITIQPKVSRFASIMIAIGPFGLTSIIAFLLVLLHYFAIKQYRKKAPSIKYSWIVIVGGIFIPLIALIGYVNTYSLIDYSIGIEAGRYHGYTFLVLLLYPLIFPIYWVAMWLIDRKMRVHYKRP